MQQGEEMPGDNTERTDEQQGQGERAPSFSSPREQCPEESHNKAQEKRAGLSSHRKWSRCPQAHKESSLKKVDSGGISDNRRTWQRTTENQNMSFS